MNRIKFILTGLMGIAVLVLIAIQFNEIRSLRSEVAELKQRGAPGPTRQVDSSLPPPPAGGHDAYMEQRLAELEKNVAELSRGSHYLMERGELPVSETLIDEAQRKFMDASLSDRERLRALELFRRNRGLTDEMTQSAISWLQMSTNMNTQRNLLQQLNGVTNAAFAQPLMALVSSKDNGVRQAAVEDMRFFVADPQVETALWGVLKNDSDWDVRDQARRALSRGPFSETRVAGLQQRANDNQASLEERLTALRALNRAGANAQSATASLVALAQQTTDPETKMRLFRAFDGMRDPSVKLPLVNGLSDPNPLVRERAVGSLTGFQSDPTVVQWLQYVSQNDEDPQVRREAFEALRQR